MRPKLAHAAGIVAPAANARDEDLGDHGEALGGREVIALDPFGEIDHHGCIRAMASPGVGAVER